MARKVIEVLTDDLDGGEADHTIRFTLDGTDYEIDLTTKNSNKLRAALQPWIAAARFAGRTTTPRVKVVAPRRTGSHRQHTTTAPAGDPSQREHRSAVREWARDNGFRVAARGAIAQTILDMYDKAMAVRAAVPVQRPEVQKTKPVPAAQFQDA
jgi:hypothetical protein